jgi:hypothetical protein
MIGRRKTLARDVELILTAQRQVRVEMPGDGNCLFRAVAFALRGTQQEHARIRRQAVEYEWQHRSEFEIFVPEMPFEQYCERMRCDGVWGSELELQAMSRLFNVQFRILSASKPPVVIDSCTADLATRTTVLLWFAHGEHFDLVVDMHRMRLLEAAQEAVLNVLKNVVGRTPRRRFQLHDAFPFRNIPLLIWQRECEARDRADTEAAVRLAQNGTLRHIDADEALARRLHDRELERARKQVEADELLARQLAQSDTPHRAERRGARKDARAPRQLSMSADDIHALEEEDHSGGTNVNNSAVNAPPSVAAPSIYEHAQAVAAAADKPRASKPGWFARLRGKK